MNTASERDIFLDAIEIADPDRRRAHIKSACGDNEKLRQSVEALLMAHDQPARLLDHGIRAADTDPMKQTSGDSKLLPNCDESITKHLGKQIGDYRLMEQIGEGGFGLVFVAQQNKPVKRKVALKIVKPGQGSKEVIARFEAERQAVALMDHTNIAQVFDAGVTDDGRPYFVMELVRGLPITEFCDNQQFNVADRLRLFCDVCLAVHHAHQKGVIHRDIKPSNVMVTLLDGKPIAKVIDFGVAKAIGQSLTDKTIYTRFFSFIGTPLYMSPEQAEMSGADVDTRSDIFSLGVLLYELLVGTTPFDRDRLDSAGFDELRRIIREEEPPRPSKRFSTLIGDSVTVADRRQTSPMRLSSNIRGDLDWIVMKALDKDRQRRYESAAAMAEDVRRHLHEQPIKACPPSRAYLLSKFAKRNRVTIFTVTLIVASLLAGTILSVWQMRVAMRERDEKEVALREIEQFADTITTANALVASARSHADSGRMDAAIDDFTDAVSQQASYYLPWVSRAQHYVQLGSWSEAADDYAKALELGSPVDSPNWWGTAALFQITGREDARLTLLDKFEQRIAGGQPMDDWEWIRNSVVTKGLSTGSLSELQNEAERMLRHSDRRRMGPGPDPDGRPSDRPPPPRMSGRTGSPGRPVGPEHSPSLPRPVCEYITGMIYLRSGQYDLAIHQFKRAGRARDWPAVGITHAPLAIAYLRSGDRERAVGELSQSSEAIETLRHHAALGHPDRRGSPWFDLVEMRAVYQEANQLINASK